MLPWIESELLMTCFEDDSLHLVREALRVRRQSGADLGALCCCSCS